MTLSKILSEAIHLSNTDKFTLIRVIAQNLEQSENIQPLEATKVYSLPTP